MHFFVDDLPELQAVQTDSTPPALFQLGADVSHQECSGPSWNQHTSNSNSESAYSCENGVNWLTELANIATSPQSPLMQCSFYNRYWHSFQFWTLTNSNICNVTSPETFPSTPLTLNWNPGFDLFCIVTLFSVEDRTHSRASCKSCLIARHEWVWMV